MYARNYGEQGILSFYKTENQSYGTHVEKYLSYDGRVGVTKNIKHTKHKPPSFPTDYCIAYFDGASQLNAQCGGVGVVIWINKTTYYNIALKCSPVTNTKSEVIALWTLLYRLL